MYRDLRTIQAGEQDPELKRRMGPPRPAGEIKLIVNPLPQYMGTMAWRLESSGQER